MVVLARLAIHSSLTHVLPFFLFSSSLLWFLSYDTLRYFRIVVGSFSGKGERSLSSLPRASLSLGPGLKTSRLNQVHVSKPKQKNWVQDWILTPHPTGILGAGTSTVGDAGRMANHSRIGLLLCL